MTIQQEHREKRETLGLEALKEQMAELAKSSVTEAQAVEIESYNAIRKSLRPAELNVLIEFKHAGAVGATNKGLAVMTRYSENTVKAAVSKLRRLDAIIATGFASDRPVRNRMTREGINILQAR